MSPHRTARRRQGGGATRFGARAMRAWDVFRERDTVGTRHVPLRTWELRTSGSYVGDPGDQNIARIGTTRARGDCDDENEVSGTKKEN